MRRHRRRRRPAGARAADRTPPPCCPTTTWRPSSTTSADWRGRAASTTSRARSRQIRAARSACTPWRRWPTARPSARAGRHGPAARHAPQRLRRPACRPPCYDFLDRLGPVVADLKEAGIWSYAHPWLNLLLPATSTAALASQVLDARTPADLGPASLSSTRSFTTASPPRCCAPPTTRCRTSSPCCAPPRPRTPRPSTGCSPPTARSTGPPQRRVAPGTPSAASPSARLTGVPTSARPGHG
ncbi:hypothetical protein AB0C70_10365 [Streptomyces sp. NPDC048564]|uniref:hypothetical protein n=1 Tax=Streptomyces sp. NPDC048564 TaxID=3155760 RepID=UPI00344176B2